MSREVEYNGTTYRWSGDRWLDAATYMPLPGVAQHGKARAFLQQACQQTAQQMTFDHYVGNQEPKLGPARR